MNKETNNPVSVRLGRHISALRHERGLSQEELGYRAGLHRTYIGAVERGEKAVTILTAIKIANGLDVSLSRIINDELTL